MDYAQVGLRALSELGEVLAGPHDLSHNVNGALRGLVDRMGLARAVAVLRGEPAYGSETLGDAVGAGAPPGAESSLGPDLLASVIDTGQPRLGPAAGEAAGDAGMHAFVCVPIRLVGRSVGVLGLEWPDNDRADGDQDRHIATAAAAMIAHAIRADRLVKRDREQLFASSRIDPTNGTPAPRYPNVIGASRAMCEVFDTIEQVAKTRATILLVGETGTGKEVIAKAIHTDSDRRNNPYIRVNCAALSGQLLESELFGHVHGAFTGAIHDKVGRFEAADRGTLLLDEISTMELPLQVKLLRVLQEREIERVGDVRTISVDVRIIAATNDDLARAVEARTFREDLFYRLNVVAIDLPALRDRRTDIPALIAHFLDKFNAEMGKALHRLSPELLSLLIRYPWPGNVRELENTIERAVVLARGPDFTEPLLPASIRAFAAAEGSPLGRESGDELIDALVRRSMDEAGGQPGEIWERLMTRVERSLIREALVRCGQVKLKAADLLGINRNTLNKKCRDLGVAAPSQSAP